METDGKYILLNYREIKKRTKTLRSNMQKYLGPSNLKFPLSAEQKIFTLCYYSCSRLHILTGLVFVDGPGIFKPNHFLIRRYGGEQKKPNGNIGFTMLSYLPEILSAYLYFPI